MKIVYLVKRIGTQYGWILGLIAIFVAIALLSDNYANDALSTSDLFSICSIGISLAPTIVVGFFIVFEVQKEAVLGITVKSYRILSGNPPFFAYYIMAIALVVFQFVFSFFAIFNCLIATDAVSLTFCIILGTLEIPFLSRSEKKLKSIIRKYFPEYIRKSTNVKKSSKLFIANRLIRSLLLDKGLKETVDCLYEGNSKYNQLDVNKAASYLLGITSEELDKLNEMIGKNVQPSLSLDFKKWCSQLEILAQNIVDSIKYYFGKQDSNLLNFIYKCLATVHEIGAKLGLDDFIDKFDEQISRSIFRASDKVVEKAHDSPLSNRSGLVDSQRALITTAAFYSLFPIGHRKQSAPKSWFLRIIEKQHDQLFSEKFIPAALLISIYIFHLHSTGKYSQSEDSELDNFLTTYIYQNESWKCELKRNVEYFLVYRYPEMFKEICRTYIEAEQAAGVPFELEALKGGNDFLDFSPSCIINSYLELCIFTRPNLTSELISLQKCSDENIKFSYYGSEMTLTEILFSTLSRDWIKRREDNTPCIEHNKDFVEFYGFYSSNTYEYHAKDIIEQVTTYNTEQAKVKSAANENQPEPEWLLNPAKLFNKINGGICADKANSNFKDRINGAYRNKYLIPAPKNESEKNAIEHAVAESFVHVLNRLMDNGIKPKIKRGECGLKEITELLQSFANQDENANFCTNSSLLKSLTTKQLELADCGLFPNRLLWKKGSFYVYAAFDPNQNKITPLTDDELERLIIENYKTEEDGLYRYTPNPGDYYTDQKLNFQELKTALAKDLRWAEFECTYTIYIYDETIYLLKAYLFEE